MRRIIYLVLFLFYWVPQAGAVERNIYIEWEKYTPPDGYDTAGFQLYVDGAPECTLYDPDAVAMECRITTDASSVDLQLSALFSDNTESLFSDVYTLNFSTVAEPSDETMPAGSHSFSFAWDRFEDTAVIAGYRIYLNDMLLCETSNPSATGITCNTDLLQTSMAFTMTTLYITGEESAASNLLVFDPTKYPQLFTQKYLTFNWDYPSTTNVAGFRIYQNNNLICETNDPTQREISCKADITSSTVAFTVTAIDLEGIETNFSNTLVYSEESSATEAALKAVITTNTTQGVAPLGISFDSSTSTGNINTYAWSFGDGTTSSNSADKHIYTTPGRYSATLTITSPDGQTSSASTIITVEQETIPSNSPIAVISSSSLVGKTPLTVFFDGAASTAPDSTIVKYSWDFGDGNTLDGITAQHTYTSAGVFTARLTVTNQKGLTGTVTSPIMVSETLAPSTNKAPIPIIKISATNGSVPMTVTFNADDSTDTDGTITQYAWTFGDGSSDSGSSVTHTYTMASAWTATLEVTDNDGATASSSILITVNAEEQQPDFNMELGEVHVNGNWSRVDFRTPFQAPVIIAGPAGNNDIQPGMIRLRNIDENGFEIRFAEWDYLDGMHADETVTYLVMEKGHHILPDGAAVEAGSFNGTTSFATIPFRQMMPPSPVVLTTVASVNEVDTIAGQLRNISTKGFEYRLREQEANANIHATETINYIAWGEGSGTLGDLRYEVRNIGGVTGQWSKTIFQSAFLRSPLLLAGIQTTHGGDTAGLRVEQLDSQGVMLHIAEEQSKDKETDHATEMVGYLAIADTHPVEQKIITALWNFPVDRESTIAGFAILINGIQICEINDATVRQLSCTVENFQPSAKITVVAKDKTGLMTESNSIAYQLD